MIEWVEELWAGFTAAFGTGPKVVTLATVAAGSGGMECAGREPVTRPIATREVSPYHSRRCVSCCTEI